MPTEIDVTAGWQDSAWGCRAPGLRARVGAARLDLSLAEG